MHQRFEGVDMSGSDNLHQGLELRELSLRVGHRLLFNGLSLTVKPGELVHLAGENGAGKTTLLKVLAGLRPADSGEVRWRGVNISELDAEYRSELVFLGHINGVKPELTPEENLAVHAALHGLGNKGIGPALDSLGLGRQAKQPCRQLSSGQRQRVALARLELLPGKLWLLDEPLTALDARGREHIAQRMIRHADRGGVVLYTSHQALSADDQLKPRTISLAS